MTPFRLRDLTEDEVRRAEARIRDGVPISKVLLSLRCGRGKLRKYINDATWKDMVAEGKSKRG